jgi:hypothetical protein
MAAYLDFEGLCLLSVAPREYLEELQTRYPGWIDAQLLSWSAWIDGRLRKRYAAPFTAPYPTAVTGWLARIVTAAAYHKRGIDPTDAQAADVMQDGKDARAELEEAANSNTGLWDLPLAGGASGISLGGPRGYTETDPYTWTSIQRDTYRNR